MAEKLATTDLQVVAITGSLMDENRFHAMLVAYFLSRENERAYEALGYGTQLATHKAVGSRFGVKTNTVKNWRDEFDAVHRNSRQGWYQRPLRPSRARLAERYYNVSFEALLVLVKTLMNDVAALPVIEISANALSPDLTDNSEDDEGSGGLNTSTRSVTGLAAEDAFMAFHAAYGRPVVGELVDRRSSGLGYDFEIVGVTGSVFVEVKGLSGSSGNVSLTSREWQSAIALQDLFFLALVVDTRSSPQVVYLQNPAAILSPRLRLFPVVQEQWCLPASAIISHAI